MFLHLKMNLASISWWIYKSWKIENTHPCWKISQLMSYSFLENKFIFNQSNFVFSNEVFPSTHTSVQSPSTLTPKLLGTPKLWDRNPIGTHFFVKFFNSRIYIPKYIMHIIKVWEEPQELSVADSGSSNWLGIVDLWCLVNASQLCRRRSSR